MPETITGTGEDELAAMIDLAIRLDERRRDERLAEIDRRGRAAYLEGAEERSRTVEGRPLTADELEWVLTCESLVTEFVPASFDSPVGLDHVAFRLRPLGPEHNASDYAAWSSSIHHIRSTPGFVGLSWPHPMTLEENLGDLVRHARDFAERAGFTYTVLAPDQDRASVIGCVYIYPTDRAGYDASVRSWVRAADERLDPVLYRAVTDWLAEAWPFERVDYAIRPEVTSPT